MNFRSPKLYIMMGITFAILFLMNYIGSQYPDRLSRALLTAASGAIFLAIGLWLYKKFGKDKNGEMFD